MFLTWKGLDDSSTLSSLSFTLASWIQGNHDLVSRGRCAWQLLDTMLKSSFLSFLRETRFRRHYQGSACMCHALGFFAQFFLTVNLCSGHKFNPDDRWETKAPVMLNLGRGAMRCSPDWPGLWPELLLQAPPCPG